MTTAIKIEKDGKTERMLFMTVPKSENEVDVDIFLCNEEFEPMGTPSLGYSPQNEETYHTELRKQAKEKGQFVPEFSTNSELNPE